MKLENERKSIVAYGKKMLTAGLTRGTGGNLSIFNRKQELIAISPSGLDYYKTKAMDVTVVDMDGVLSDGKRPPSTEMPMHLSLYAARKDIHALVHTHSVYATTLSCLRIGLPPLHYTIGFAGPEVLCAPYATYGTRELARTAVRYMKGSKAVLLANHGLLAAGSTLQEAFSIAEMVEFCAELYCRSLSIGKPKLLTHKEMLCVCTKLKSYGK